MGSRRADEPAGTGPRCRAAGNKVTDFPSDRSTPPIFLSEDELSTLRRRILTAVLHVCPRWLAGEAEDVAQNALIKVVEILKKRSDRNRDIPSSYLSRVAYSVTVDAIRSRRQGRLREVPMDEKVDRELIRASDPGPERCSQGAELIRTVRECMGKMVKPRRLAAMLYIQGHTVPEIGRLMHWSGAKANNLVYRGISDLRRCLAGKGIKP